MSMLRGMSWHYSTGIRGQTYMKQAVAGTRDFIMPAHAPSKQNTRENAESPPSSV